MTGLLLWVLVLGAAWLAGVWGSFAAFCSLRMREVPGALMAWLAGAESRRRLRRIIEGRQARKPEPLPAPAFGAELARLSGNRPVTAALVLRAYQDGSYPEPSRLVAAGEPACDDPACTGCRALQARLQHEAAL